MDKKILRTKNLALRKSLNQKQASKLIVSKIFAFDLFLNAKNVLIYYPLKYEISLLELLSIKEKNYYLPRVNGKELEICPYSDNLVKSSLNIMEPLTSPVSPSIIDLAFIPAICVDKFNNRIGYGGGFYDRLLSNSDFLAPVVAVINKELIVDKIDSEIYDKKVGFCITD